MVTGLMAAASKLQQLLDDEDIDELKKLIMYLGQLGDARKCGERSRDDVRIAGYAAIAEFERTIGINFVELDRPVCDLLDASTEEVRRREN